MTLINMHGNRESKPPGVWIDRRSKWGNPFPMSCEADRMKVIWDYTLYILRKPELLHSLHELKGKDLLCWCAPKPCHGQVLEYLVGLLGDFGWVDGVLRTPEDEEALAEEIFRFYGWSIPGKIKQAELFSF